MNTNRNENDNLVRIFVFQLLIWLQHMAVNHKVEGLSPTLSDRSKLCRQALSLNLKIGPTYKPHQHVINVL